MAKLPGSYRHVSFDTLDSTNKYALKVAAEGDAGNLWVTAGQQSDGRGRRGRPWSSNEGNLFASLLLIDPAPIKDIGQLPLVSAVAVHRAICDVVPPHLRGAISIKWPNDVLWDNQKICGILLESSGLLSGHQAVVVGIGVNCRTHPDRTDGLSATNLSQSGYDVDPLALFERLAFHMAERLDCWNGGLGLADIREDWLSRVRGLGKPIVARLPNEEVHGVFEQLDEKGGLIMLLPDGTRRVIYAGDVFSPGTLT
ncbi:biotin--[acetyl-CoA-carboxylase] ligase [Cohaesibacter celericrescens]|uniref:biotin--[acetyl-CoA-carboxylase] ligase n=1 Tax=Cohaesibacter celericrescens TaxID=2067669 RepID=UPI0015E122D7|nr:biotin--[acetyl-CoA-carboxylase] ligase [Cohaesibacter celericrescens]